MKTKNRLKKIFTVFCTVFICINFSLSSSAVIQYVEAIGNTLDFRQLVLQNNTTGQQQVQTNLTVEVNNNGLWNYGNTRVFGNVTLDPNQSYTGRLVTIPVDSTIFNNLREYKIIVNMYLLVPFQGDKPELYMNDRNNVIYAFHPNNTTSSSIAVLDYIQGNNMAWIHYKYELTCDDPITQLWFNFGFDTSDAEDSRQMLITFFGNMQIDNLYNNQIGSLESTIIGNPEVTESPELDKIESQYNEIDEIINEYEHEIDYSVEYLNRSFLDHFATIIPAMSLITYCFNEITLLEPIAIIVSLILVFSLAKKFFGF